MKLLIIAGPYEADRLRRGALQAGFETVAVEPGESLSGWITASRPDVIVLAPQIVHHDPELALAKVRAVPRGRVPIFLVGEEKDEARMSALGEGFFVRPVTPELVMARLRASVGGSGEGEARTAPRSEVGMGMAASEAERGIRGLRPLIAASLARPIAPRSLSPPLAAATEQDSTSDGVRARSRRSKRRRSSKRSVADAAPTATESESRPSSNLPHADDVPTATVPQFGGHDIQTPERRTSAAPEVGPPVPARLTPSPALQNTAPDTQSKPTRVFVCYRRRDSGYATGHLGEILRSMLGSPNVFQDTASIPPGVSFPKAIDMEMRRCSIVLAVIGRAWLSGIELQTDHVRVELEAAIRLRLRIIPVLVDGATPPGVADLPPSLQELATLNAALLRPLNDFRQDVAKIVIAMETHWGLSAHQVRGR